MNHPKTPLIAFEPPSSTQAAAQVHDTLEVPPALPDVDVILAIRDPLARNERINDAYRRYGAALRDIFGTGQMNFAHILALGSEAIGRGMRHPLLELLGARDRFGQGNHELFAMAAPHFSAFVRMMAACAKAPVHQRVRDEDAFTAFESRLLTNAKTPDNPTFARAFRQFYEAALEPDLARRRQRVFFGNLLFAFVEQKAAQPVFERTIPRFLQPLVAPMLGKMELASRC